MKIGILGTRGIPNHHGGFEQFAEFFALEAQKKGHDITVYNSNNHPYQESNYNGVNIIHCYDPENKIGTAGQFIYDLNCILNSRKQDFDIVLQLGYTSSSIWFKLHPKKAILLTNMDGLEWKRSKYSKKVQSFLLKAEKWAANTSDYLISDSIGIQDYIKKTYHKPSTYIAYGATLFKNPIEIILKQYNVKPYSYNMLIARMEPENNIETILDGVALSNTTTPFLVIGKNDTNEFGKQLTEKYKKYKHILFIGGVYNQNHLDNLRYYSNLYFHGHSVGGTNPSLLEAMASSALIIANNNPFNKAILQDNAYYFKTKEDVKNHIENSNKQANKQFIAANLKVIASQFNWNRITNQYLDLFNEVLKK
jgi:glycosyltransferase involved in cell wall biosynthesis